VHVSASNSTVVGIEIFIGVVATSVLEVRKFVYDGVTLASPDDK
jgi:hypothetical protein